MLVRILSILLTLAFINVSAEDKFPTLTVKGEAVIAKPADQIELSAGVVTEAESAEVALRKNNDQMEKIISNLKSFGLDKSDYQTGRFNIRPVYSQRPKAAPPEWKAQIIGYEVSNVLNIRSGKIDKAGELIDVLSRAGVNKIDSIRFSIKDPRNYRKEIIAKAASNAIADAKALAEATGMKLDEILRVSLDDAQEISPFPKEAFMVRSTPIEPGEVEIRATVTILYELTKK